MNIAEAHGFVEQTGSEHRIRLVKRSRGNGR